MIDGEKKETVEPHSRLATEQDVEAIFALQQKVKSRMYSSETEMSAIRRAMHLGPVHVIEIDSQIIAMISWEVQNAVVYVADVVVDPAYQGHGIGNKLMAKFVASLPSGMPSYLLVHPENLRAKELYERYGFREVERLEDPYGEGEPRLRMVRRNTL